MARSGFRQITQVSLTATPLVMPGNHRRFVMISNPTQDVLYWDFTADVTAGNGFMLPPNQRPERIYREEIGGLIDGQIWAIFGVTAGPVAVLVGYES